MKHVLHTLILVLLATAVIANNGGNGENKKTYRVVAIKKGDAQVESVSNHVQVLQPMEVYIPNAFTPNGDGVNDSFGAKGVGIEEYKLAIYNKWGELLFESESIDNQWDGTYAGQNAKEDAYVYDLLVKNEDSSDWIKKTGSVTLLR